MRFTQRKLRLQYRVSSFIVLWLIVVGTIAFHRFLEAGQVPGAGLIVGLTVLLPGLYAFYTFRIVYAFARYRNNVRTTSARPE